MTVNPMRWVIQAFRYVLRLLAPMVTGAKASGPVFWFLHFLILAAILVGLYFLQARMGWGIYLAVTGVLRDYWLPLLFLLLYGLFWAARLLPGLLKPPERAADFPDLEAAWDGILEALDRAGVGLADTPVYVAIGDAGPDEHALFRGLPGGLAVEAAPSAAAPLRCYANRDAIYLVCPGVTLINQSGPVESGVSPMAAGTADSFAMNVSIDMGASIGGESVAGSFGGGMREAQEIVLQAQREGRALTDSEKEELRRLASPTPAIPVRKAKRSRRGNVLQDAQLVAEQAARMACFVELLASSRWPLCPLNGAVVVLPADDAETADEAGQLGLVAAQDLAHLAGSARLWFPVYALLTGVDRLPGAAEFFDRFGTADRADQRLGKGFPVNPDLPPEELQGRVETTISWILGTLMPYWTYKLFRLDKPEKGESVEDCIKGNGKLLMFHEEARNRAAVCARMVSRATAGEDAPALFAGCYVTAVRDGQALFLTDFFRKVDSTQGYIAWTEEAFREDARYRRMTMMGYGVMCVIIAAVAGLAGYTFTSW